ncbi:transglutaminase TgpA family protein [Streptomyces meridianus]|uniref:DUF3488 and transglutaminase-like domain-containing protein n=1 Tax=Streptomyces meridianus TaxID=2938945 RepID=A0ABT0X1L7_9ACTN|nr:DUF3488 and transglutaminase-like domain-containing protein [Streptomyces meridianus]MCM2576447.1 DUF3488 and transglutaminase-like domain-containing protein [Streptomyces meridianus]
MSGQARLTVCAAAATLMAACSLLPLVDSGSWILRVALLLMVLAAVGGLARRVPLARPLTVASQTLVALLLLTLMFVPRHAVAGVLPGPDAMRAFAGLLAAGVEDVGRFATPAPVTIGIRLLLVGGVVVIGLSVDALAVTYRRAAPAGLPLLALYSVAAGLAQGGARWLWFLFASGGYLLLLLAEGRDRLSQWGRLFSGVPGWPGTGRNGSGGSALAPVRTGRRIGAVALGVALLVPTVLPSLDGGLLAARRAGGTGSGPGGTISAVNPLVSLQNSLNQSDNREVLNYRTDSEQTRDLYLRIVALDRFDGTSWKPSERRVTDVPSPLPPPDGLSPGVRTTRITSNVSAAEWYAQNWLPLPYPATDVDIDGRWRYEPAGRTLVGDRNQTTRGVRYRVTSLLVQPTPARLARAGTPPSDVLREYTRVPASLPPVVARTAEQVTAGASNDYERAVKLQTWFATDGDFEYDTKVRPGNGSQAITRFLRDKKGFCVHFAFSMAAMARTLKIPARVAVGFTPGSPQSDGSMSVGLKDAHAWPELYFPGVGWTRFEPTPTRGTIPEYAVDDAPTGSGNPEPETPGPENSEAPPAAPPSADACPPQLKKLGECPGDVQREIGTPQETGPSLGAVSAAVLLGLVVVLLPFLPMLWREKLRRDRLGRSGDGAGRTLAAWREFLDSGWDHGIVPDDSRTPRKAAEAIVRGGRLSGPAAEAAHRLAEAVDQVLYAPVPRGGGASADDVRRVRAGLHASAKFRGRLQARFAPRSSVRVLWTWSRWWAAVVSWWEVRGRRVVTVRRPFARRG